MKLKDLVPDFEKFHIRRVKPSYQKSLYQRMRQTVLPTLGEMELDKIGRRDVGDLVAACEDIGLANKTINEHLSVLSLMFKCAFDREYIETYPVIKRVKLGQKPEIKFLETHEVVALIEAIKNPIVRAMAEFGVYSGLRVGELRALEWKHVDFERETIRVCQTTAGWNSEIGTVKGSENRTVPLLPDARKALQGLIRHDKLVFIPRSVGGPVTLPLSYQTVHKSGIRPAAEEVGVYKPGFGFHTLRHTYASHLARKGVSLFLIQKWLGHVDVSITQRYAHLAPDTGHIEAQVLTGLFSDSTEKPEE